MALNKGARAKVRKQASGWCIRDWDGSSTLADGCSQECHLSTHRPPHLQISTQPPNPLWASYLPETQRLTMPSSLMESGLRLCLQLHFLPFFPWVHAPHPLWPAFYSANTSGFFPLQQLFTYSPLCLQCSFPKESNNSLPQLCKSLFKCPIIQENSLN